MFEQKEGEWSFWKWFATQQEADAYVAQRASDKYQKFRAVPATGNLENGFNVEISQR